MFLDFEIFVLERIFLKKFNLIIPSRQFQMNLSSQSRVVKPRYILLYCCSRFLSLKPPHHSKDHYKTLGIPRNATTKEIKIAFYELSKKHHPDMNPDNKVEAAQKFQNLSEAYEVLTSDEKRRIYDSLSMPSNSKSSKYYGRTVEQSRGTKEWSDLDIDYKDFEHFQRLNRRKRAFHRSAGNTTDAFWAAHHGYSENYKNNRALEREMLERQLEAELEEIKRRTAHPMPTFEQLIRQEEERIRKEKKRINIMMFGAVPFITMIFVIISFRM